MNDQSSGASLANARFVVLMVPKLPYDAPAPDTLYIDPATPESQVISVQQLVTQIFGTVKTKRMPLRFSEANSIQIVEIPGVLTYRVLSKGESPSPLVAQHLYPWLFNPVQGVALDVSYYEPEHDKIRYSGTNSLSAELRIPKAGQQ